MLRAQQSWTRRPSSLTFSLKVRLAEEASASLQRCSAACAGKKYCTYRLFPLIKPDFLLIWLLVLCLRVKFIDLSLFLELLLSEDRLFDLQSVSPSSAKPFQPNFH